MKALFPRSSLGSRNCLFEPPNKDITIKGRTLRLTEPEGAGVKLPIDRFLRSLAEDAGEAAIGIILSGAGSDGALGVKEIKGVGGLVIVQEEAEAEYDGMPRSAIDTGAVDLILPVGKMAEQVISYVEHPLMFRQRISEAELGTGTEEFTIQKILSRVRIRTGHDFSHYKRSTVQRRIARRMAVNRIESVSEYAGFINKNAEESQELFKDLVINVTNFFRDPEVFDYLAKEVVPKIVNEKHPDSEIRMWVPGCATGEEAYSLAILFVEAMEKAGKHLRLKVFATDINPEAISKARHGAFQENIAADVSPERLKAYFTKTEDGYLIRQEVREEVVFALHDITRDAPFLKMDLVSCRNLLIYMDGELQKKIIPILHYSLNPGGTLILGTSESVGAFHDLFDPMEKKSKVFRKKRSDTYRYLNEITTLGVREQDTEVAQKKRMKPPGERERKARPPIPDLLEEIFSDLEPPGVIVDRDFDISYSMGNTGPFLSLPAGEPTFNLIRMANESLRFRLAKALESASQGGHRLRSRAFLSGMPRVT